MNSRKNVNNSYFTNYSNQLLYEKKTQENINFVRNYLRSNEEKLNILEPNYELNNIEIKEDKYKNKSFFEEITCNIFEKIITCKWFR